MALDPLQRLRTLADARAAAGTRRALRPRPAAEDVLDLASNDYLGLARDARVIGAAAAAAGTWGAGSTGSRLVTGSTDLHAELEARLAGFAGAAAGLVFSSGYLANLGAVSALSGRGGLVVSDAANHASIVDACRLGRADVVVVAHLDVAAVAAALGGWSGSGPRLVVTDAVFSVDGDRAPLDALHAVARRHGALLLVDEAHSLGVVGPGGRGAAAGDGLAGAPDVVLTVTLSKSLAAQGGAVLGDPAVVDHLVNTARAFIFDTALAPPAAAGALAALRVLQAEPWRAEAARARAGELTSALAARGLDASPPAAAVVSVRVGAPAAALDAAAACLAAGVRVGCFRPPSVPDGVSRLRLTARADLTAPDVRRAADVVAAALGGPDAPG